ncbi:MAG TPA: PAS domain S-box protein [Gammaproteobacteria bacterium]|nr:PAS domain S-box protein [Gammaproteobacteria bacterium]
MPPKKARRKGKTGKTRGAGRVRRAAADGQRQAIEGRYASLFEHAPDGIVVADTRGYYLDANPAICRMLGYSHGEFVRLHSRDIVVPAEAHRIQPAMDEIRSRPSYHSEWHFRRKDGSVLLAEVFAAMMPDGDILALIRDITERKRLEAEIALREQRMDAFFTNAPAGLVLLDRKLRFVQINETVARINGIPVEAHLGRTVREVLPDLAPVAEPPLQRVLDTGEPVLNIELQGETPAEPGKTRYWTESFFPIPGQGGVTEGVGAIFVEITDRKQAEVERDRLFNLSLDMLCVADFEGRLLHVNPAWTKNLGWSAAELTAVPMNEFILPEDHEATRKIRKQIYAGTPVRGFQNRYRCKDGSFRWFSWNVHPLPELKRVFAVARDITEQRAAEEESRRREEEQRRLVEELAVLNNRLLESQAVASVGSWETDLRTMDITWTDEVYRIFDKDPATFKPTYATFIELVHPEDRASVNDALDASMHKPGSTILEHRILMPDGKIKFVEERWRIFNDAAGKPVRAFGTCQDISERKDMEAQFLRAQRLESIGTLAGGIAHDLNNVLAPIMVASDMLEMDLKQPENLEVVRMIKSSTQRAADLVKQVLSFSRGVQGQRVPVDMAAVVQDLNKLARDTFPKNIGIEAAPAPGLWQVKVDPTQLHQVLLNLYVNARDAMPQGGSISVELRNESLDEVQAGIDPEAKPGDYVVIQVADTGEGMAVGVLARIFDPFFTTKEVGKGTGLGLSTVLGIVKGYGGFINVYSEPGRGTTFKLYFPAAVDGRAERDDAAAAPLAQLPRGDGELILVVDDEEAVRNMVKRTLERFGYKVQPVSNGAEAVSLYAQAPDSFAAVLTDMSMPVMDGPATIVALKTVNPQVVVVGSSGLDADGHVAKAAGAGVRYFIPKPYSVEAMLKVLAEAVTESRRSGGRSAA